MKNTIAFAESLRPHGVQYNILDYLLGTPMWQDLMAQGLIKEGDWKTNHRVYEYFPDHCSRNELESLVNEGYGTFLDSWKSVRGLSELLRTLMVNKTSRKVIMGNLTNPSARKAVMDGLKGTSPSDERS